MVHEKYREDEREEREEYIHLRIRRRLTDPNMPFEILPEERDSKGRDESDRYRPSEYQCRERDDHAEQKMRYRPPVQTLLRIPKINPFHSSSIPHFRKFNRPVA